jgi:hypothetical protein
MFLNHCTPSQCPLPLCGVKTNYVQGISSYAPDKTDGQGGDYMLFLRGAAVPSGSIIKI